MPRWRKASRSDSSGACVEIAVLENGVGIRDSKDPHGTKLLFDPTAWTAFLAHAKAGHFDL